MTLNKKLNDNQLEAVKHKQGPLLIIAGAGTGKTTVITERVKWLITNNLAKPSEILALTFTDKAAKEMEERVDVALPYSYSQMWITTFHAFGEKILRHEAIQVGLNPGYRLMTESEAVLFLRKNLFSFELDYFRPLGNPNKFIEGMLSHFSRLKDEDVSQMQYIKWSSALVFRNANKSIEEKEEALKYSELAKAYQKYEELKVTEGLMDFSDLISNTLKLFRLRKNVLKTYQKQFKYILIDEFQDTNVAQNELAILLSGKEKNITVVGDDDQAIYRWRGAAISNILQFKIKFPDAKTVVLNQNYRSTKEILEKSYRLIKFNDPDRLEVKANISKKLKSERKIRGNKTKFLYSERSEDEAQEVVNQIKIIKEDTSKNKKYNWSDFAILVRANNHSEPFIRALLRKGMPYQFLGPGMLFRQKEIKELISYLKALNDFTDSVAFFNILSMSIFDINPRDLFAINNFVRKIGVSIFEGLEIINAHHKNDLEHWSMKRNYKNLIPFISDKTETTIDSILDMVNRHLELAKTESAGQIIYYFLQDTGLLLKLTQYKSVKEEKEALNISKFFDKLKSYETEHEDASIHAVCEWLDMSMELGESPLATTLDWTLNNAVNILTVHSSKGLEFPVVFLVNLVNQRFPTSEKKEQIPIPDELVKEILPVGEYHLEEERRLFYVGMTRAKDILILTASKYYAEGKRERKISPFVIETLGEKGISGVEEKGYITKKLNLDEWMKDKIEDKPDIKMPIEYLSFSQIQNFSVCPLQYKYRYILKIPVKPNAAGSFGTSIHATLERFYKLVKEGHKPIKKDMLNLLEEVWLPVGYGNKNYEENMKKRGKKMLSNFFTKYYEENKIPIHLEMVFKMKLSNQLKIGGKIDRIDSTPEGKLEIIDYKTGNRPTDKKLKDNLQMTVYAMAATDKGIFGKKAEDVILTFYFLEQGEKVSMQRNAKQLQDTKITLLKKAEEIDSSRFEPKVGPWCGFCDFRLICEAWR